MKVVTSDLDTFLGERLLDGRLKLRHLVLAIAVDEAAGIVRAASRLHLTQPVLTRALQELESIVGLPLFVRSSHGTSPTEAGAEFLTYARVAVGAVIRAGRRLDDARKGTRGTVRVGTQLAGSSALLPLAISRLRSTVPDVAIIVRESARNVLRKEMCDGRTDLVVGRLLSRSENTEDLHQRPLLCEPIVLAVRQGHPVAGIPAHARLTAAYSHHWVVPLSDTALFTELATWADRYGDGLPANLTQCDSYGVLRTLLLSADGIATLPRSVVAHDRDLCVLDVGRPAISVQRIGIIIAHEAVREPAVASMVQALVEVGAELDGQNPAAEESDDTEPTHRPAAQIAREQK